MPMGAHSFYHSMSVWGLKVITRYTSSTFQTLSFEYEGKSISNQPIPFPIDRDTQDFHALFQYMF